MKNILKGKVAVITGASSGIGLAIANKIHKEGVIVYDISKVVVKHDCIKNGYEADVNDNENVSKILENIFEVEGHIDIFINNAGFGIAGAIEY